MNPRQILLALQARYKVIALLPVICITVILAVHPYLPVQYTAQSVVWVDQSAADPIAAAAVAGSLAAQVEIIMGDRVARKVVKALELTDNPVQIRQWLADPLQADGLEDWLVSQLRKSVSAVPAYASNVIAINVKGDDPDFIANVANAYAQAYIDTVVDMKVEPAKQFARWFENQATSTRRNVELAQERLLKYQRSSGALVREEQLEQETAKLSDLSSQLSILQRDAVTDLSKQLSNAESLPEIMNNPTIAGLRSDISKQEAELQLAAVNIGKNHPEYLRMESQLDTLHQRLEAETQYLVRSGTATRKLNRSREIQLRAAVEAQTQKVLNLRNKRSEVAVLQRDIDAAAKAYETVVTRFNQTSLESHATQTNVSQITVATTPIYPSSPKSLQLLLVASVGIGLALGLGAAILLEIVDRRVRSTEDLSEMLQLPVLGVITRAKKSRRLPFLFPARRRLAAK